MWKIVCIAAADSTRISAARAGPTPAQDAVAAASTATRSGASLVDVFISVLPVLLSVVSSPRIGAHSRHGQGATSPMAKSRTYSSAAKPVDASTCPGLQVNCCANRRSGAFSLMRMNSTLNGPDAVVQGDASTINLAVHTRCVGV